MRLVVLRHELYDPGMNLKELKLIADARELLESGCAIEIRKKARLSQSEIAAFCRVDPAAVSRWESKSRIPRGGAALRLARLLRALEAQAKVGAVERRDPQSDEPAPTGSFAKSVDPGDGDASAP